MLLLYQVCSNNRITTHRPVTLSSLAPVSSRPISSYGVLGLFASVCRSTRTGAKPEKDDNSQCDHANVPEPWKMSSTHSMLTTAKKRGDTTTTTRTQNINARTPLSAQKKQPNYTCMCAQPVALTHLLHPPLKRTQACWPGFPTRTRRTCKSTVCYAVVPQ